MSNLPSNMNELEEGEISNDNISSPEKNKNASDDDDPNSASNDEEEASQGFFHKFKQSKPKQDTQTQKTFKERSRSSSPSFDKTKKYNSNNKFFNKQSYQQKNLKRDLCKYFINGNCTKGDKCTYSHIIKDFPCKYFHSRGFCENKDNCKFSHKKMNKDEAFKFIHDHEQFLIDTKKKYGKTSVDEYLDEYLNNKKKYYSKPLMNKGYYPHKSQNNWMINPTNIDINSVNAAKNILLSYQMMNNMMTGGYPMMNFFPNPLMMMNPAAPFTQNANPIPPVVTKQNEEKSPTVEKEEEVDSKGSEVEGPKDPRVKK